MRFRNKDLLVLMSKPMRASQSLLWPVPLAWSSPSTQCSLRAGVAPGDFYTTLQLQGWLAPDYLAPSLTLNTVHQHVRQDRDALVPRAPKDPHAGDRSQKPRAAQVTLHGGLRVSELCRLAWGDPMGWKATSTPKRCRDAISSSGVVRKIG